MADRIFYSSWNQNQNMMEEAGRLYSESGIFDVISPGDLVAVKIHAGELGNPNYIRPFFIKQILDKISSVGGKPFLTDTSTYYHLNRSNAVDHMQTALTHGFGFAPFIVADGLKGENVVKLPSPGPEMRFVEVAGAIHQADAMIVVSHFKGHALAGFGGAIKNLGMGCVSKSTKLAVHRLVEIELDSEKCLGCGECGEACRFAFPYIENGKAVIDDPGCMRCPVCSNACPEGAIRLKGRERLGKGLACAAVAVMSTFSKNKTAFINFLVDISSTCDCVPSAGNIVSPDQGIAVGFSPLDVDEFSLQRIDYNHLNQLHDTDCHVQIRACQMLME